MWLEFNRAFAKTPTETVNSGEVTEVAVKYAAWRAIVEADTTSRFAKLSQS